MKTLLILTLLLTGCATNWTHSTKDDSEYWPDLYRCEVDAAPVQDPYRFAVMRQRCMEVKGWRVN